MVFEARGLAWYVNFLLWKKYTWLFKKKDPISAPVIVIDEVLQQSKWQEFDSFSTRQVGDSPERSTQSENNLRFIVRTSQEMSQGEGVHTSCHSRPRACQRFWKDVE